MAGKHRNGNKDDMEVKLVHHLVYSSQIGIPDLCYSVGTSILYFRLLHSPTVTDRVTIITLFSIPSKSLNSIKKCILTANSVSIALSKPQYPYPAAAEPKIYILSYPLLGSPNCLAFKMRPLTKAVFRIGDPPHQMMIHLHSVVHHFEIITRTTTDAAAESRKARSFDLPLYQLRSQNHTTSHAAARSTQRNSTVFDRSFSSATCRKNRLHSPFHGRRV